MPLQIIFVTAICLLFSLFNQEKAYARLTVDGNNTFMSPHVYRYNPKPLSKTNVVTLSVWLAAQSLDLLTSDQIALLHGTDLNPAFNARFPSTMGYDFIMPAIVGITAGFGYALPNPWREVLFGSEATIEVGTVIWNISLGYTPVLVAIPAIAAGLLVGVAVFYIAYEVTRHFIQYLHSPRYSPAGIAIPNGKFGMSRSNQPYRK